MPAVASLTCCRQPTGLSPSFLAFGDLALASTVPCNLCSDAASALLCRVIPTATSNRTPWPLLVGHQQHYDGVMSPRRVQAVLCVASLAAYDIQPGVFLAFRTPRTSLAA
ncbi:hypothetical protein BKA66DRAFT_445830 [Pyrenochaeta sp. MPI-SDFR-AT-0127]|nr:hypothetical protein BKA66DRAFT_445830 [Pyrenochaeta sp. MPI-SDFR-AT-0127]